MQRRVRLLSAYRFGDVQDAVVRHCEWASLLLILTLTVRDKGGTDSSEVIMFDADKTIAGLTSPQKARLIELLESGNSLPWTEADDVLKALKLVQPGHRRAENATLNNWGWTVAMLLQSVPDNQ